jgi:LacI family transcriptional regulator
MPVTLEDIAKRVGKSITTVSRALHGYEDVSPETKVLVRSVAEEMGYTPSTHAQRLQKRRSDTLGLILPTFGPRFADPFFGEFIAGVGNMAASLGYDLLVSTRPPGELDMETYRNNIKSGRVDGFILVRTRRQDLRIEYLLEVDFPFVAFGRSEASESFPLVDEDSELGMRMLATHLLELGHRRIACINGPNYLNFTHQRRKGVENEMARWGLAIDPSLQREGNLSQSDGYKLTQELLALPKPPTAIVACNDMMAFGAMSAAQERSLVVGKDISITGFDDIPMSEYSHPPLTTLRQPIYEIGSMVCDMLIKVILGHELTQKSIIIKPDLVVRQSTGRATRRSETPKSP